MRARVAGVILVVLVVAGCGSSPSPGASGTPIGSGGAPLPSGVSLPPLPTGTISDPREIGRALLDPARTGDAVVSLLNEMGVEIRRADGSVVVEGSGDFGVVVLPEVSVHGLIAMATHDAELLSQDIAPASPRDLHVAVSELVPELSLEEILGAFASAYAAASVELVPQVLAEMALEADAPVSRVQLWLMLIDGFVAPALAEDTAAMTATIGSQPRGRSILATSGLSLPFLPSPDPLVDIRDFNVFLSQLIQLGFTIPYEVTPGSATAHEGHGGPGSPVVVEARHVPYYVPIISPRTGLVLTVPSGGGLSGLPVTWSSSNESVFTAHGAFDQPLGTPVQTSNVGTAAITYQPKPEDGDQSGALISETGVLFARVEIRDLVLQNYLLVPAVQGFLAGYRQGIVVATLEWHEAGYQIDGTYRNAFATGTALGRKCDGFDGEWVIDGTYTAAGLYDGIQTWVITVTEAAMAGTFTYTDHQVGRVPGAPETQGQAAGTVTVAVDELGDVHMHLTETSHSFRAKTTAPTGGYGNDQAAPLQQYDFIWEAGADC